MYNISTPSKGVAFGKSIPVSFILVPLLKGLRVGKVESSLYEKFEIRLDLKNEPSRTYIDERKVFSDTYDVSSNLETQDIDGQDGYSFSRQVSIPRNLRKCMQTVAERNMKIKHEVRFVVALHNPDEHVSEVIVHSLNQSLCHLTVEAPRNSSDSYLYITECSAQYRE